MRRLISIVMLAAMAGPALAADGGFPTCTNVTVDGIAAGNVQNLWAVDERADVYDLVRRNPLMCGHGYTLIGTRGPCRGLLLMAGEPGVVVSRNRSFMVVKLEIDFNDGVSIVSLATRPENVHCR